MDVHSKYPGVAVAFKSRQACQSILNDVMRHLSRMLRDGSIDDDEYKKMRTVGNVSSYPFIQRQENLLSFPFS